MTNNSFYPERANLGLAKYFRIVREKDSFGKQYMT